MKTAVVILNWNTKGYLETFLPSVLSSCECSPLGRPLGDTEVVVADNGSTDGSLELLKESFPEVKTIFLEKNFGFTGGYNRALAQLEGYEYFVLLNSDVETPTGWLSPAIKWMDAHPGCGACAPKIMSYGDRESFEYAGAAGGYLDAFGYPFCRGRVLGHIEKDKGQYNKGPKDVFWVSGACMVLRTSTFDCLDERFFAHFEEIDLCWRLQLGGYKVTALPFSKVYHIGGGTLPNNSPGKLMLNYRNNLLMLSNNLAKTYAIDSYRRGNAPRKAAARGIRKASFRIFERMVLDDLSAMAYLLKGKLSWTKAVFQAHREYRTMRTSPSALEISAFVSEYGYRARIHGLYRKWIIPRALLMGKGVFKIIRGL